MQTCRCRSQVQVEIVTFGDRIANGSTFKLGVGPGHNWGMHGHVRLNSIGLVGVLVGGGSLKWHILVLIPGAMLRHMRLNLMGRVLVLQPHPHASRPCTNLTFVNITLGNLLHSSQAITLGYADQHMHPITVYP